MELKTAAQEPFLKQASIKSFFRAPPSKRIRLSLATRDLVLQNTNVLLHVLSFVGAADLARNGAYRTNQLWLRLFKREALLWKR
jgi:hypothetical protein